MRQAGIVFTCLSVFWCVSASGQNVVENTRHGYSLEIPEGWNEASDKWLDDRSRRVSNPDQLMTYVGAYQEKSFAEEPTPPYVLVLSTPYRDLGWDVAPPLQDRARQFEALTEANANEVMDGYLSDYAKKRVDLSPVLEGISYDEATGAYVFDMQANVDGLGPMKGRVRGIYGEWAFLQAGYYAKNDEWEENAEQANTILDSFAVVDGAPEPKSTRDTWLAYLSRKMAVGGVVLGVVVLIAGFMTMSGVLGVYIYRRRNTPKPPPL